MIFLTASASWPRACRTLPVKRLGEGLGVKLGEKLSETQIQHTAVRSCIFGFSPSWDESSDSDPDIHRKDKELDEKAVVRNYRITATGARPQISLFNRTR